MINAMIGEIEELIVRFGRKRAPTAVHIDTVARAYGNADWKQFRPLVREAGRLLQRRGLVRVLVDREAFEYTGA